MIRPAAPLRTKTAGERKNAYYGEATIARCMTCIRVGVVSRALLESRAAHGDPAQAVASDFLRGAEREVQHTALRIRPAILNGAVDLLAVLEIGDDEDGAERLGAMRAGDFVGLEALAARVPLVFPVNGCFFVVGRRARDAAHPDLLEGLRFSRQRAQ